MMELDLSTDYLIFDGRETVQCYAAIPPEVGNTWTADNAITIADARIEKITTVENAPTAGVYGRADTRWRLPATICAAAVYVPKMGDLIQGSDLALWVIVRVGAPRFNNSWSCDCLQLLIAGGLCDTVTLMTATTTNVGGSKVTSHAATVENIECRIQPLGEQEIQLQARLGYDVNVAIYLKTDVANKFNDLFVDDATGEVYEIKYSGSRRRLDVLSVYFCRKRP